MTKGQGHHMWRDAPEAAVSSKPVLPGAGRWELWCPGKVCDYVRLGLSGGWNEFASKPSQGEMA